MEGPVVGGLMLVAGFVLQFGVRQFSKLNQYGELLYWVLAIAIGVYVWYVTAPAMPHTRQDLGLATLSIVTIIGTIRGGSSTTDYGAGKLDAKFPTLMAKVPLLVPKTNSL